MAALSDRFVPLTQITPWRAVPTRKVYVNFDRVEAIYRGDSDDHTIINMGEYGTPGSDGSGHEIKVVETLEEIIAIVASPHPAVQPVDKGART